MDDLVGTECSAFLQRRWLPCTVLSHDPTHCTFNVSFSNPAQVTTLPEAHVYPDVAGPSWLRDYGSSQMGIDTPQMIQHLQLRLDENFGGSIFEAHYCHCMLGNALNRSGRYEEGLMHYKADLELTIRRRDHAWLPSAYGHVAEALINLERWPEALDAAVEQGQAALVSGSENIESAIEYAAHTLLRVRLQRRDVVAALELALVHDTRYGDYTFLAPPGAPQCSQCWRILPPEDTSRHRCGEAMRAVGSYQTQGPDWDGSWKGGRARNHLHFARVLRAQARSDLAAKALAGALVASRKSGAYGEEVTALKLEADWNLQDHGAAKALVSLNAAYKKAMQYHSWLQDAEVGRMSAAIAADSWAFERILWIGNLRTDGHWSRLPSDLVRRISAFVGYRAEWATKQYLPRAG